MERGARERWKGAQDTSGRVGMRPLDLRQQPLASFVAYSPSRDHSSWKCRGPTERRVKGGEGEMRLLSVETVTVGSGRIV